MCDWTALSLVSLIWDSVAIYYRTVLSSRALWRSEGHGMPHRIVPIEAVPKEASKHVMNNRKQASRLPCSRNLFIVGTAPDLLGRMKDIVWVPF